MAPPSPLTYEEAVHLEKSYWDAMKAKNGSKTADLSAKSSLVAGPKGIMRIEKREMSKMTEEGDWVLDDYEFEDVEVTTPSPDVAIIAYTVRQDVRIGGTAKKFRAADISTWIRGSRGWECHAHSETVLGAEGV